MKSAETIDQHIQREVFEEVGLRVDPAQPLYMWSWQMRSGEADVIVVAVARFCKILSGQETTSGTRPDDHISELNWCSESELYDLDVIPSQKEAIRRIAELLGGSTEGCGRIEDHPLGLDRSRQDDTRTTAGGSNGVAVPAHVDDNEFDRPGSGSNDRRGLVTL